MDNADSDKFALGIEADTGPWLRPVQYERKARPGGNAHEEHIVMGHKKLYA